MLKGVGAATAIVATCIFAGSLAAAGDSADQKRVAVAVVGVDPIGYGLPCLSPQCHEFFLVALKEPVFGLNAGQLAVVSHYFTPREPQLTRGQLDATRDWMFTVTRSRACDAPWRHYLEHAKFETVDPTLPSTIAPDTVIPCLRLSSGGFSVGKK
jgi:hypothetical protein